MKLDKLKRIRVENIIFVLAIFVLVMSFWVEYNFAKIYANDKEGWDKTMIKVAEGDKARWYTFTFWSVLKGYLFRSMAYVFFLWLFMDTSAELGRVKKRLKRLEGEK